MKKLVALILTAVLCLCCLASCNILEAHSISYPNNETERFLMDGYAPTKAKPGDTVVLRTGTIMDANIEFYANGVKLTQTHADSDYWEYIFTMPAEDVVITHDIIGGFGPKECVNHIDENKDGICDTCEYEMNKNATNTGKVQTTIGEEASLPQFMSLEVDKYNTLSNNNTISVDVYMGYIILNKDGAAFSDIVVPEEDFENYTFVLEINYNNETREAATHMNYFEEYECDMYQGVVQYNKYNTIQLDTDKMTGKSYGFVNVELYMISNTNQRYFVSAQTLYYSVTESEIVFGLVSNPVATEGDPGIITKGWEYSESSKT